VIGMTHIWVALWLSGGVAALFRAGVFASGNNIGANVASLLKGYASELYVGIVAIVGVMFLANRRYNELALFLFATVVVAWLVFDPSGIATAAEGIGKQIFG
jgi:hypothetical protein